MKYLLIFGLFIFMSCNNDKEITQNATPPDAEKIPYEIVQHGEQRVDNYFWMRLSDEQKIAETPDEQTQKVLNYLNAENAYRDTVLAPIQDFKQTIFDEIVGRIKKDDSSLPYFENGYWYYTKFEEGKEYPIYCRKKSSLDNEEIILLDVNEWAKGHDYYQAGGIKISPDNKLMAFAEDTVSRRIYTIRIKNLETGEILPDVLKNTTGGVAWANDNKTLFYTTKNKMTLLSEKIYRHQLGVEEDVMIYHEKDPSYYIGVYKSKSNDYVVISTSSTLSNDYWILPADQPEGEFKNFTPREKELEYSVYHYQDKFYVLTNWDATNYRLMITDEDATAKENWKEVIAHREDVLLENIEIFENYLVVEERTNGLTKLRIISMQDQSEHYVDFDEPAYVTGISVNPEFKTDSLRFTYSSLTTPVTTYDYNMDTRERTMKKRQEVVGGHNPEDYVTERLWATASDGKKIPISIVFHKSFNKDGNAPLLLYGYGSYGAVIDPYFSSTRLSLLDRGFAFAIAHIRGGQMLGRAWYEDGKMFNKINTFTDFIDCGQYLIDQKYTSTENMYSQGGSAGGLLMGAVINIAPELFHGVAAAVPFVDVINTMSDPTIPLTTNEYDEWGNPEIKEQYDYIKKYSPYENVAEQNYPHLLVTTGYFDSQVQYWEPAKWVAKLRDYNTSDNLIILSTNMETGHSGAAGRFERYKDTALSYAFFLHLADKDK